MGSSTHPRSFGQAFKVYEGLQIIISSAYRSGAPIHPDYAVAALQAAFPGSGVPSSELRKAVVEAAREAGVSLAASRSQASKAEAIVATEEVDDIAGIAARRSERPSKSPRELSSLTADGTPSLRPISHW